jgi:hypothetical protein
MTTEEAVCVAISQTNSLAGVARIIPNDEARAAYWSAIESEARAYREEVEKKIKREIMTRLTEVECTP